MSYGYQGKILWVDLTAGEIREEIVPDEVYQDYLGGQGLGAWVLYNRMPAKCDPLGPENILGLVPGLLTATGSLFTGRWSVVGKSPLTGTWGDANCGGTFGPAIKRCGVDGIFVTGISPTPVYLYSNGDRHELRDASHLWGVDATEAEQRLIDENTKTTKVALIGMAGEKLSKISGVCNDRGRIAARSGLGAVMGSKRLKAVVLDGKKPIPVYDRVEMKRLSKRFNKWVQIKFAPMDWMNNPATWVGGLLLGWMPFFMMFPGFVYGMICKKWGTTGMNMMSISMGDSPLKNWGGTFNKDWGYKKALAMGPDRIAQDEFIKYHCYSCPLGCGGICKTTGRYHETHKPEYETWLAFGGLCMNEDVESIYYINEYLNRAGMDSISAGGTVSFAIEAYERGLITKEDTGGLELTWGNTKAMIELIHMMVERRGIGDLLADGSKAAALKIGNGAIQYAIQAGGQEPAMHDSRLDPGLALHYSVEPSPGRHTVAMDLYYGMYRLWTKVKSAPKAPYLEPRDSAYKVHRAQAVKSVTQSKYSGIFNSVGFCIFGLFYGADVLPIFEWLNASTGWRKTPDEYMEVGARIHTTKQAFNIKQGVNPIDNRISDRALGMPPQKYGVTKGRTIQIDEMMRNYWGEWGWDPETGRPTPESLARYQIKGIDEVDTYEPVYAKVVTMIAGQKTAEKPQEDTAKGAGKGEASCAAEPSKTPVGKPKKAEGKGAVSNPEAPITKKAHDTDSSKGEK